MSDMPNQITQQTAISIGLVLTLLAAAFSFGYMVNKVDALDDRLKRVESEVVSINDKLTQIILNKLAYEVQSSGQESLPN